MIHTAVTATADGSVVIPVDMDISDAEKELSRLKKLVFKLEYDIEEKEYQRNNLVQRRLALENDLLETEKKRQAMLDSGQVFDNSIFESKITDLKKQISTIEKQIDKVDESIEKGNISLEHAKNRYGEIAQEAERLKTEQADISSGKEVETLENIAESAEIADQRIVDLNKELANLKQRQKYLSEHDFGLGHKEYDENEKRIIAINRELKEYYKTLREVAEEDIGEPVQSKQMAQLSSEAQETVQRISELREEISDLQEQQAKLGLHFGKAATAEYNDFEARISDLNQELVECQSLLDGLAESGDLAQIANGSEIAEQRIEELTQNLEDLEQQRANLGLAIGAKEEYNELSAEIERINELIETYKANLSEPTEDSSLENLAEDAEVANQHIVDLNRELLELKQRQKYLSEHDFGLGHKEYDQNTARIAEITRELKEYQKSLAGDKITPPISRATLAAQKMNAVLSKSAGLLKSAGTVGTKVFKAASKAISNAAKKAASFALNLNVFSKLTDGLNQKFKRLGQMIKRVFVFSVITSGLRAIRTQMSGYLKVNTEFMTALRRLQGVLLTAFQPIYEVAVPALTTLINVLSKAAAVVTQFFAALFGTTAKQAQTNAKDLYEQANATTAAGDAAEEASKQLAGFDEINKLSESSSTGGGAVSVDTGPLFDYEYDETPFDSWGEAFSAFLDKLLDGIPKLKEKFKDFADWLNDFAQKLYDMFTFPGVLDKVKQLGRDLADALNFLTDEIKWELLGRALGAGLNLALNFLTSFIYEYDWMNLGKHLAEFVNGLVDEIDWYEFGRLLWAGFKIGLETLAGFILGLDMPLMADAASNIVKGFFDEMKNTIEKIPWGEIGAQIALFLTSLDWTGMFASVYGAFSAALDGLANLIIGFLDMLGEQLDMHGITDPLIELVQTVHDFIQTLIEDTINWVDSLDLEPLSAAFQNLLEAISPLVSLISDGLLWAYENVLLPLASWVIEEAAPALLNTLAAAIEFLTTVLEHLQPIAEWVWNNFLQPLASFTWDVISGALEVITNILQKLTDLLSGNTTFSEFLDSLAPGEAIILGVATALGVLATAFAVSSAISAAGALISGAITAIGAALAFLTSPIGIIITAITALATGFVLLYQHFQPFRDFIDGIVEGVKNLIPGIIEGIESGWNSFMEWWDGLWEKIVDAFKNFFGIHSPSTVMAELGGFLIAGLLQGLTDTWNSIVEFFTTAWEGIKSFLIETWENLKTTASEKFGEIKDKIGEVWDNVKEKSSETWNNIKTTVGDVWTNLKDAAKEKFDNIKQSISDVWDNLKTKSSETWSNIKTFVGDTWTNLKEAATEKFTAIKEHIVQKWAEVTSNTEKSWSENQNKISTALGNIWDNVTSKFTDLVNSALTWGKDICQNIADGISSGIKWVQNAVSNVAKSIKDFLGFSEPKKGPLSNFHTYMPDMLELMSDGIRANTRMAVSAASDLADAVANSLNRRTYSIGNVSLSKIPDISTYSIPRLAQGAVIPPNREFMAVLGDQKHGTNIEAPLSTIEQAMENVMSRMGMGSNSREMTIIMQIDGREFGRASYKYGTAEQQRVGVRLTEART